MPHTSEATVLLGQPHRPFSRGQDALLELGIIISLPIEKVPPPCLERWHKSQNWYYILRTKRNFVQRSPGGTRCPQTGISRRSSKVAHFVLRKPLQPTSMARGRPLSFRNSTSKVRLLLPSSAPTGHPLEKSLSISRCYVVSPIGCLSPTGTPRKSKRTHEEHRTTSNRAPKQTADRWRTGQLRKP